MIKLNEGTQHATEVRILLVDDHALFRRGLQAVLAQKWAMNVEIKEAESLSEALSSIRAKFVPDLILLDIQLPGVNGLDGLQLLRQACMSARVAMMSALSDRETMAEAMARGADGYICKTAEAQEVLSMVSALLRGESCFGEQVGLKAPMKTRMRLRHQGTEGLTARQLEVLALLAKGHANKVIARELQIAENTVRIHVAAVLDYFECSRRVEAVLQARERGLLT